MKKSEFVKEEMHVVFKKEMFQESEVYKLINEETGLELFTGILIHWLPEEVKFAVPSDSYFARAYNSLVEKYIDRSLAIISFSPSFLEDSYALKLLG